MTRMCHNCITSSITIFQIILQYYDKDIYNMISFSQIPNVEFYKSIFMQLETIVSQVRHLKIKYSYLKNNVYIIY